MAQELKQTVSNFIDGINYTTKVYFDTDWQEYQVRLFINGTLQHAATYHTDDAYDAYTTARVMCKLQPI